MTKTIVPAYRITGDHNRTVYSQHSSEAAAIKAAKHLAHRWGVSHVGSEPIVEVRTEQGWRGVVAYPTADAPVRL